MNAVVGFISRDQERLHVPEYQATASSMIFLGVLSVSPYTLGENEQTFHDMLKICFAVNSAVV